MKRSLRAVMLLGMAVVLLFALAVSVSATELKTGIGIVNSDGLRLRASASTDSDILANAAKGDNVVVIRQVGDWYLVDYNLEIGYMSAQYLTFKERENVELGYGKVNTASVNMRATPSSEGDLVAQLAMGEKAYIIGLNCGWYKVQYNGMTGYIRSDLMELTQAPASNSQGSYVSVASQLVSYAESYMGTPYVWGGTSPSGFDCSGFTKYCYQAFGVNLNRTAAQQLSNGSKVGSGDLAIGDLVFFGNTYSSGEAATHVGIYVGNNQFIHAASGGVKVTSLSDSYYASRYVGARRII